MSSKSRATLKLSVSHVEPVGGLPRGTARFVGRATGSAVTRSTTRNGRCCTRHSPSWPAPTGEALKAATDDVFFVPGVDRATVQSLFTPNVRFIEVVEEGFAGGNVIPATFRGTAADLATVAVNVQKAGLVGRLVSNDLRGALIRADLLDADPQTGKRYLEYA